jgi:hypothetical protein
VLVGVLHGALLFEICIHAAGRPKYRLTWFRLET